MTDTEIRAHALTAASAFLGAFIMAKPEKDRIMSDTEVIKLLKENIEVFTAFIAFGEFDASRG